MQKILLAMTLFLLSGCSGAFDATNCEIGGIKYGPNTLGAAIAGAFGQSCYR